MAKLRSQDSWPIETCMTVAQRQAECSPDRDQSLWTENRSAAQASATHRFGQKIVTGKSLENISYTAHNTDSGLQFMQSLFVMYCISHTKYTLLYGICGNSDSSRKASYLFLCTYIYKMPKAKKIRHIINIQFVIYVI